MRRMVDARRNRIILASASSTRRMMLERAGIRFDMIPAQIDERTLQAELSAGGEILEPPDLAKRLAEAKALDVSARHPGAFVIGSDQVLDLNGTLLNKPGDLDGARSSLISLRGQTHRLHSGVAMAMDGALFWHCVDTARLTMRAFTDEFLDAYLAAEGRDILGSVGAYRLEGLGLQLFERVEGDYFTVLGMPLLLVLNALRDHAAISS
jgi:septum formation protein